MASGCLQAVQRSLLRLAQLNHYHFTESLVRKIPVLTTATLQPGGSGRSHMCFFSRMLEYTPLKQGGFKKDFSSVLFVLFMCVFLFCVSLVVCLCFDMFCEICGVCEAYPSSYWPKVAENVERPVVLGTKPCQLARQKVWLLLFTTCWAWCDGSYGHWYWGFASLGAWFKMT